MEHGREMESFVYWKMLPLYKAKTQATGRYTQMGIGSFLFILLVMASGTSGSPVCSHATVSHVDAVVTIHTPNYPNTYPASTESCWVVNVTSIPHVGDEIYLLKTSIVASVLEDSVDCVNDYAEIRDGGSSASKSLGRWCGASAPQLPMTSGSVLHIYFKSDSSNMTGMTLKGFHLKVKVAVKAQDGGLASQYAGCDVMRLGSTALQYTLISPGYPNNYPDNLNKCWVVLISTTLSDTSNKRIQLTVPDSQLENEASCEKDQVTVKDGDSANSKLIVGWCGSSRPAALMSCDQKLYISLKTNHVNTYRGFIMNLNVVDKGSSACSLDELASDAGSAIAGVVGAVCSVVFIWLMLVGCRAAYDHQNKRHVSVRHTPVSAPTPLPPSPTPDRGHRYLQVSRPNSLSPFYLQSTTPAMATGSNSPNSPMYGISTRQMPSDYPSELSVSPYTVTCDKGYAEPMQPGYMATTNC